MAVITTTGLVPVRARYVVQVRGKQMRLAEALIQRSDCQKRFEQVKQRIVGNAKVQEGDQPSEDPGALIQEMEGIASELLKLIARINKTNSSTIYSGDKTMTDALAERDVLMLRRKVYSDLARSASVIQARTSRSEVKFLSTVNVKDVQTKIDALSKEYRDLDSGLQELNWKTNLMD